MYSPEIIYLVNREKHNERLRKLERQQMLRLEQPLTSPAYPTAVRWLGAQMVKWGSKLQNYEPKPILRNKLNNV